ncbi:hypothetical protein EVAR_94626_1 [Eumeta japonica]|uniref:Uncharacterized protein n=1 Tax=Eumeta variegata TaxID=151549 RepID=A0A4C1UUX6_EUMVA|nr:hypothetical protein EVAR_94626_1 [Eumeta japonica]
MVSRTNERKKLGRRGSEWMREYYMFGYSRIPPWGMVGSTVRGARGRDPDGHVTPPFGWSYCDLYIKIRGGSV